MSANCNIILIFPIYGQFGAICKPDSGSMGCKTYISLIAIFYLTKTENKTKKYLTQISCYCFEQGTIFDKNADFFANKC